ncbi:MAG: type ISP restriction/modification enzyme [Actinomycetota bacterium]
MELRNSDKLKRYLENYLKKIHKVYIDGDFTEESFYSALSYLIEECSKLFGKLAGVTVVPRKTEAGIPDFLVKRNGEIIGYIEAKVPDANLKDIEDSKQLKRYLESLPNLVLTNFLEFRLYRQGKFVEQVEVGRQFILQRLEYPPVPERIKQFFELLEKFFSFSTPSIKTSFHLSIELAKRTRFLEHLLQEELSKENEEIKRFYKAFQEVLIGTLTPERFADLYAQTITYGLFAARMRVKNGFNKDNAWRFIPGSLLLLRDIFYSFTGPHFPESLSWIVDDITQLLEKADVSSILEEFKTTRWEEDPVIHFYETFLATYNPKERERLGVYYTPLPVVSYIVRSIHILLKERFNKSEGLANRDVTLLDPAAGTLTFVVQAIKQTRNELEEKRKGGLIRSYIEEHILPHFYAFEILVAPYTVGHFKITRILEEMGYQFKENERFQFYLTNTLEMKEPKQISLLVDLTKEGQAAKKIKEKIPILVILGNPPYSVSSENKSEFIEKLMEDYKEDVRDERNIQPLSDDYIKFIRFAHWKIDQAGNGIIGYISNNSYLSGVIHRGIRRKLFETFDEIYILNLHGSSRIREKTPEGGKDENVFDIQQGVTIVLYVKLEKPLEQKKVYYADLWGVRSEKYGYLFENDVCTTKWQELEPVAPYYFFVPKDFALQEEYEKFWKVTEIFKEWSSGITTHRDHFVVGFTKEGILQRLRIFTGRLPDELVAQSLNLKDTGTWKLTEARQKIRDQSPEDKIYPYAYRPFDVRFVCYESTLIDRPRLPFMKNLLAENLGLALVRILSKLPFSHAFVSKCLTNRELVSVRTKERTYVFPLYLYPDEPEGRLFREGAPEAERVPNFTAEFLQAVKESLGTEPTPEELFYYIYAVLYSPTYRKRYQEFLKIDFPRVPLSADHKLFKTLSGLGKELAELHLLKHPALQEAEVGFPESGSNKIEKIHYDEKRGRVYFNKDQYFEGISKDIWEYRIGAYQVMDKYLRDRKGRRLSIDEIEHYMKVAKAIRLTIDLQQKIDGIFKEIVSSL